MKKVYLFLAIFMATFSATAQNTATCTANFEYRDSIVYSPFAHYLKFFAKADAGRTIKKVCWNFGDGTQKCTELTPGTATSTLLTVTHKYPATSATLATYNVCLTIVYEGGCEAHKCIPIQLQSPGTATATCTGDFRTELGTATNSRTAHFIAAPQHSAGKKPVYICWSFGDGSNQACQQYAATYTGTYTAHHTYANAGTYEVCMRIVYEGGCEVKKCRLVTVPPPPSPTVCAANIKAEHMISTPLGRRFTLLPEHNAGKKPVLVCWKFSNSTQEICKQYAATYTGTYSIDYTSPNYGSYEVCVRVLYDGGCEVRKCVSVKIEQPATCEVNVHEAPTSVEHLERKFYLGLMNDRPVEKICWNFGDGSEQHCYTAPQPITQNALIASHKYPAPGTYKLCVRVVYKDGCVAEKCREIVIRPQVSNMPCGGYMTEKIHEKTVEFKGVSLSPSASAGADFSWNFGDGSTATGAEVKHTYATAGTYQVCLTIKTPNCETRICKKIVVGAANQPKVILSPNPVTTNLHVLFYSTRAEAVNIRIYNANGLQLRSFTKTAVAGANNWDFADVATLPSGVYTVIVQSSTQFATAIFFKQ